MTIRHETIVTAQASTTNTIALAVTTTHSPSLLVVVFMGEPNGGTMPTVFSVAGASLTWARRSQNAFNSTDKQLIEVWWAAASSTITAQTITVTCASNFDDATLMIGNYYSDSSGIVSWDSNGSLPHLLTGTTGTAAISTTATTPRVIALTGDSQANVPSGPTPSWLTQQANIQNGGAINWEYSYWFDGLPGTALSSTTVGFGTIAASGNVTLDALAESGGGGGGGSIPNISGITVINGTATDGVTVDVWLASRFGSAPAFNDAPPSGSPDYGPVTSADTFGEPGAFGISSVADGNYYVRMVSGSDTYWQPVSVGSGGSGGGADLPVADTTSYTTKSITDPTGIHSIVTQATFPGDQLALGVGFTGDAYPRWLLMSDATDGLYFSNGTVNPYDHGGSIYSIGSGGIGISASGSSILQLAAISGIAIDTNGNCYFYTGANLGALPVTPTNTPAFGLTQDGNIYWWTGSVWAQITNRGPIFMAHQTVQQTIASTTDSVLFTNLNVDADTASGWNASGKYYMVQQAGYYLLTGHCELLLSSATTIEGWLRLYWGTGGTPPAFNPGPTIAMDRKTVTLSHSPYLVSFLGTKVVAANVGDTLTAGIYQNTGTSQLTSTTNPGIYETGLEIIWLRSL